MDYEKKYKEALGKMREMYPCLTDSLREEVEHIFPELIESEDERIRNDIMEAVENWLPYERVEDIRAYLKKHKEQKPTNWNDADMKEVRENLISVCRDWERGKKTTLLPIVAVRARYFLEHLVEPKQPESSNSEKPNDHAEWSEEDKTNGWTGVDSERYLSCLQKLGTGNPLQPETINSKWFKKHCRPQPHWKPSEEQMKALKNCVNGWQDTADGTLESLYNDLKKL